MNSRNENETNQSEFKILRKVRTNDFTNTVHCFHNGVIEVIDDGNVKAVVEELNHRVSADETGTAGNKYLLRRSHHSLERERETFDFEVGK